MCDAIAVRQIIFHSLELLLKIIWSIIYQLIWASLTSHAFTVL